MIDAADHAREKTDREALGISMPRATEHKIDVNQSAFREAINCSTNQRRRERRIVRASQGDELP